MPSTAALAPVRQVAAVTSLLVVVTCTVGGLGVWAAWHRHEVAGAYVAGEPGTGVADHVSADNTAANIGVLWMLSYAVTAVMFLTWAWRARTNAERLSRLRHRLGRGWVIGGWLVPTFPLVVLEDVWRTSRPNLPAVDHVRELPRARLVRYWWYSAAVCVLTTLWFAVTDREDTALDESLDVASVITVLATLQIVPGALLIAVIRQITEWQCPRDAPDPAG